LLEILVGVLQKRFKTVPDDLRAAILDTKDLAQLTAWIDLALSARMLRSFRKQAGL
jgi:hypothetical protein